MYAPAIRRRRLAKLRDAIELLLICSITLLAPLCATVLCTQAADLPLDRSVRSAEEQIRHGDFAGARDALQNDLKQYPLEAGLWNLLGIAEGELHNYKGAEDAFLHGLNIASGSVPIAENLGFLYFRQGDYPRAKKYLARAVELGSNKAGVKFSLAASRLRTGEQKQGRAELKALEAELSSSHEYWEERGAAEMEADAGAAENDFSRALALAPASLRALNGAASVAEKQGLDEKALSFLIKAREAAPDDVTTLMHFGLVCLRRDLGPDALSALERAHRLQPSNGTALYLLARANIAVENWHQSLELFQEFAKRAPDFPTTYYAMGWLEIKLNRPEDARRDLEHCLSLAPKLTGARYELAQMDVNDGRLEAGERQLRTVLAEEPDHVEANILLGDLLTRRGSLDEAQQHLEAAIRKNPRSGTAHYKLATVLARKQEPEKAQAERALAARLNAEAKKASKTQLKLVLPDEMRGR
jgi:tetratricopeptide (TPR) repeat protein